MAEERSDKRAIRVTSTAESAVLHRLEVEVDAARVRRAFDKAYRDLARQSKVRGFRPGKAPRSVLEKYYGASLQEQIERSLLTETLPEAVEESGLQPVSEPAVDAEPPSPDAPFRYTARVEVKPEISLPDTEGLPAQRPAVSVSPPEVEAELERLRFQSAPVLEEPEGTPIASGHLARVDCVGRLDGQVFDSRRGLEIEVGSESFAPGFDEQLLGARSGEDREIQVHFPDDHANASLRGKDAQFSVHVVEVKRRQLPDLDDDFAKDLGDFETLDELRRRVESDLLEARERAARDELRRTLMDALIERAPFDVPPGLVDRELRGRLASAHRRLEGSVPESTLHAQLERWKEEWRDAAVREVRESLLLEAVARAEGLAVADPELEARLDSMAEAQGVDAQRLRKAHGDEALGNALRAQLLEEKALDFLLSRAKVEETTVS